MRKILWSLLLTLALVLAAPAWAAQGKGQGKPADKGKPAEAGKPEDAGKDKEKEKEDKEREEAAKHGRAFGKDHEKTIRDWFGNNQNLQGLPPGLAKREQLPPGLQRHLERNGTLPPGLQKKVQPLPESLDKKLPKTPDGVKRVVVAGNVILLEERTSKVLDIVKDVFGGSKSTATTGVRRTD
ncbi:MAG: hypothetical protein A3D93_00315 [Acidobacteria bacterium RIFCSPHIGHO2_12_FULL_67_30]|nr:MAG: hypothetical protein A3D93_00315 [Acidobacteria bacterium RIFCSPHIGHO2_12_FULL_67_30]